MSVSGSGSGSGSERPSDLFFFVRFLMESSADFGWNTDNAIPIEGWINDPTDNDLLHLIPLLEGLQYVTDVRALLALRRGEVEGAH